MATGRVMGGRVTGGRVTGVVVVVGGTVVVVGGTVVVMVGGGVGLVVGGAGGEEAVSTGGPAAPPADVGAGAVVGGKLKASVTKDGKLDSRELFSAVVCGAPAGNRKGVAGLGVGSAVGAGRDPDGSDVAVGVGTVASVSDEFWVDGWRLRRIVAMPRRSRPRR